MADLESKPDQGDIDSLKASGGNYDGIRKELAELGATLRETSANAFRAITANRYDDDLKFPKELGKQLKDLPKIRNSIISNLKKLDTPTDMLPEIEKLRSVGNSTDQTLGKVLATMKECNIAIAKDVQREVTQELNLIDAKLEAQGVVSNVRVKHGVDAGLVMSDLEFAEKEAECVGVAEIVDKAISEEAKLVSQLLDQTSKI